MRGFMFYCKVVCKTLSIHIVRNFYQYNEFQKISFKSCFRLHNMSCNNIFVAVVSISIFTITV